MRTLLAELTGQPSPLNWLVKHTAYPSLVIGLVRKNRGVQHAVKGAHWTSKSLEAFRVIVDMHIHKKVGGKMPSYEGWTTTRTMALRRTGRSLLKRAAVAPSTNSRKNHYAKSTGT
jgi:hypothetical protein